MKILNLSDYYPPYYIGGYELICQRVTDGLRKKGHAVSVLTSTYGVDQQRNDGHIYRLLSQLVYDQGQGLERRVRQIRRSLQAHRNYKITLEVLKKTKPDIVLVWHMLHTSILPILAAQDLGHRIAFNIGSHWLVQLANNFSSEANLLKKSYRRVINGFRRFEELRIEAAIMVSKSLRQHYLEVGLCPQHTIVIPNGIPETWIIKGFSKPLLPGRPLRLLYAGRFEEEKGTDTAIKAIGHLVKRGRDKVKLDLIGRGRPEYTAMLEELINSHGLQHHVRLMGFMSQSALVKILCEYDCLLFTTLRWEGLGMIIIEAMAQGLIVIASDIGGPNDIIKNGKNGFLVPANKPVEWATSIEQLLNAPSLHAEISAKAIEEIRKNYTADRMVDQYESYLIKLVN